LSFQQIAVLKSFTISAIAVLAFWLKMNAEKTRVLWLNRNTEEQAFSSREARARQVAAQLSAKVRAVLANTEVPMYPTRSYSGQHLVQGIVHRRLLFRVERVDGVHQNVEWIARKRFFALARQSQADASPVRLGSLSDQVPTCLKCLDDLRCGATGGRLKLGESRWIPGERIGAGEIAERHPLGGTEFAVIALGLHEPSHLQ
jgi:hypothetical protein